MSSSKAEFNLILIESKNYRDFIRSALEKNGFRGTRTNYAAFARKSGFSSRSYPRDVLAKKKRITLASLPKFIRGLGLTGDSKEYFQFLVAFEEHDIRPDLSKEQILKKLLTLRERIRSQKKVIQLSVQGYENYERWQRVFAGLGSLEEGASLEEIQVRTKYSKATCLEILNQMQDHKIINHDLGTNRYYVTTLNFHIPGVNKSSHMQMHFKQLLTSADAHMKDTFESGEFLFFESLFSVDKARLPELKTELRKVLLDFVENSENSSGMNLVRIFTVMGPS